MKQNTKIIIFIMVMIVAGITFGIYKTNHNADKGKDKNAESNQVDTHGIHISMLKDDVEQQHHLEKTYLKKLNNGHYTKDNILVIPDPYNNAPLTALALFKTEQPAKVAINVPGKTKNTTITNTFDKYQTTHTIPILGLLSSTTNHVQMTIKTKDGQTFLQTLDIQTDDIPDYIGDIDIEKAETDKMELGNSTLTFYIPSTKYPFAFDTNGDVRWYSSRYNSHVFKELDNGHILFLSKNNNSGQTYNQLMEMDYIGKYYHGYQLNSEVAISEGGSLESTMIHHDAIELPNHNLLLTVNGATDDDYIEDVMIEVNRKTGKIVKSIDFKDILPEKFYQDYDATSRDDGKIDWLHQNAVVYDPSDDSIIISSRNQDMVMKLDYKTSNIKWILSAHEGWPDSYKQYLLKPKGESFKYPAGQHATIILPDMDDNDQTIDLQLYDNNTVVTRGDEAKSKQFSRGVQYRINEKDHTVQEIWSFGEQFGKDNFTNIIGSARYLPETGNRLVNFGHMNDGRKTGIYEVGENGNIYMKAIVTNFPEGAWGYRAERFSLYNANWQYQIIP